MMWNSGLPSMLAAPISCRTYQAPRDSSSTSSSVNMNVWSGKWPQKMITFDQTLRTTLATALAASVDLKPLRPDSAG